MTHVYHKSMYYADNRGMEGGGFVGTLVKAAKPLLKPLAKRALKTAKKAAIKQAIGLGGDLILGKNVTRAAKTRAKKALKMTALGTLNAAQQSLGASAALRPKSRNRRVPKRSTAVKKKRRVVSKKARGQSGRGRARGRKKSPPGISNKRMAKLVKQWRAAQNK